MSAMYACAMMATALTVMASATSLQDCDADMTGFELVTGYVFTAPDDLLDSIPGTLMLTDCLEACHANDTCYSVNYETGLCVMFSSNADAYPGKYTKNNNNNKFLNPHTSDTRTSILPIHIYSTGVFDLFFLRRDDSKICFGIMGGHFSVIQER